MRMIISLTVFYLFLFSTVSQADCDDAKRKCRNECSTEIEIQNNGRTVTIDASATDFQTNCESACKSGEGECEDTTGALSEKCDEFKRKCERRCPSSVYIYSNSKGLKTGSASYSNAEEKCRDACKAGYRRCE